MTHRYIVSMLLAGVALPGVAAAQQDGTSTDVSKPAGDVTREAERQSGISEIVVTAQRNETPLQRTPVSVQAYTGEELTQKGVTDITSLAQSDTSININYSTGQPIIAIRGVSSQNATEIGDPAVSVATDGIFTNRPYGVFGGLYDVQRVEILRGPQGTLFGRNSTGGTINVITARPVDGEAAGITAEAGNYNLLSAQGFGNFGIGEGLNARVSFYLHSRKGFRDNSPQSQRGDDSDVKSARLQLGYESADGSLEAWVLAQYSAHGGTGAVRETLPFEYKNGVGGEPVHEIPDGISDGKTFLSLAPYVRDLRHTEFRGGLTYTFDNNMSVSYLGGYDKIYYFRQQSVSPYFLGSGNGPLPIPRVYHSQERPETINQELRFSSDPNARLNWQFGGYFFREASVISTYVAFNPDSNIERKGVEFDYPSIKSNSKALFAQASYELTDQLTFTAGGRYTWDKKSREGTFFIYPAQTGLPFTITVPQAASTKSSQETWTLGLDYQVTPDNMLYAKVSTGYKVGGFNNADSSYGPENLTSYEIGSKNTFLNRHLQLNIAAFRMDYDDQQVTQFVSGAQSSGSLTVNAGKSRIWGAEFNAIAQSEALGRLALSANYTDAKYKEFLSSAGWDSSINLNLAGNRLPLSPKWSLSGDYQYPIYMQSGAVITPRISAKYQSSQYFAATNYNSTKKDANTLVDASIQYTHSNDRWSATLWAKNIFDKTVFADATEFYLYNNYQYSYQDPRTYGVRLSANF